MPQHCSTLPARPPISNTFGAKSKAETEQNKAQKTQTTRNQHQIHPKLIHSKTNTVNCLCPSKIAPKVASPMGHFQINAHVAMLCIAPLWSPTEGHVGFWLGHRPQRTPFGIHPHFQVLTSEHLRELEAGGPLEGFLRCSGSMCSWKEGQIVYRLPCDF